MAWARAAVVFVASLLASALGSCSAVRPQGRGAAAADYLPLRVGAAWRYAITGADGRAGTGTVLVDGLDYDAGVDGVVAYRIRQDLLDGTVWSWEREQDGRVACLQEEIDDPAGEIRDEETYDPPITVLDERADRLVDGAAWPEAYLDTEPNSHGHPKTKRAEVKWEVESLADQVTVPAGTFTCLRVRRAHKHHPTVTSWYAKGVGLVKQQGAGPLGDQTLALVEAHIQ
ncbi:MAG TPA: hypothetical protein VHG72_19035 [Polyangia bacterium]|nr:hypothetical protein [Polyangia bacterium]